MDTQTRPPVLIVDDDPILCVALAELLQMEGYDVELASAGPVAIAAFERRSFRLVLLDIGLQHIDGVHLARFIRKHWPQTRIAIHSGTSEPEIRERFSDYEAFLLKPQSMPTLLATVARLAGP